MKRHDHVKMKKDESATKLNMQKRKEIVYWMTPLRRREGMAGSP